MPKLLLSTHWYNVIKKVVEIQRCLIRKVVHSEPYKNVTFYF